MRHHGILPVLSAVFAASVACAQIPGAAAQTGSSRPEMTAPLATDSAKITFADVLGRTIPAVVTVRVTSEIQVPVELKPGQSLPTASEAQRRPARSGGSGVVVDPEKGHILTNNHVIEDAVRIEVVLSDGRLLSAKLVGRDIGTDLAVIEVAARDLKTMPVGDSDEVRVGDVVLAIGNPFGLEGTATLGIVSATRRSEIGHEAFEDFFQIDAVINPGNSGGALVSTSGELIAINTATAGRSGNVGIGFAIPINMAKTVMFQLIEHGRMRRGSVGLVAEDLTVERAAELMSGTNRGAMVTAVVPGSPAALAGIEPGSIVTEVNGKPVRSSTELKTRTVTVPLGAVLTLVVRKNGVDRRVSLVTAEIKEPTERVAVPTGFAGLGGLVVSDIAPGNAQFGSVRGAQVIQVARETEASRLGLQPGDVITGVDDRRVTNSEQLLSHADRTGMTYRLIVRRNDLLCWIRVTR